MKIKLACQMWSIYCCQKWLKYENHCSVCSRKYRRSFWNHTVNVNVDSQRRDCGDCCTVAERTFVVCCSRHDSPAINHLVVLGANDYFRFIPLGHGLGVRGCVVDSRGCVLAFEEDWEETRFHLLHLGTYMKSRNLECNTAGLDIGTVRCR